GNQHIQDDALEAGAGAVVPVEGPGDGLLVPPQQGDGPIEAVAAGSQAWVGFPQAVLALQAHQGGDIGHGVGGVVHSIYSGVMPAWARIRLACFRWGRSSILPSRARVP